MYELLLFDADGTILDYEASEYFALGSALKQFSIDIDLKKVLSVYREINREVWALFEQGKIDPVALRYIRFKRLFEHFAIDCDPQEFSKTYLDLFGQTGYILPGTHKILEELSKKYRLALITNGLQQVQYNRLDNAGLREYFSPIIISDEVGFQKPDPGIFEILFEQSGHSDKKTSLIIGDSLSSDIAGGIAFGIDTCWINERGTPNQTGFKPTYEIGRLSSLLEFL